MRRRESNVCSDGCCKSQYAITVFGVKPAGFRNGNIDSIRTGRFYGTKRILLLDFFPLKLYNVKTKIAFKRKEGEAL